MVLCWAVMIDLHKADDAYTVCHRQDVASRVHLPILVPSRALTSVSGLDTGGVGGGRCRMMRARCGAFCYRTPGVPCVSEPLLAPRLGHGWMGQHRTLPTAPRELHTIICLLLPDCFTLVLPCADEEPLVPWFPIPGTRRSRNLPQHPRFSDPCISPAALEGLETMTRAAKRLHSG